jgi:hypothetical protein
MKHPLRRVSFYRLSGMAPTSGGMQPLQMAPVENQLLIDFDVRGV